MCMALGSLACFGFYLYILHMPSGVSFVNATLK